MDFRRVRKRADCEAPQARRAAQPGGVAAATDEEQRLATFKSHTVLCCELVDWVVEQQIPGTFAFDSYFTNAPVCNPIARHERGYVGDLKFNRGEAFANRVHTGRAAFSQMLRPHATP